jgi:hypothetical protein
MNFSFFDESISYVEVAAAIIAIACVASFALGSWLAFFAFSGMTSAHSGKCRTV